MFLRVGARIDVKKISMDHYKNGDSGRKAGPVLAECYAGDGKAESIGSVRSDIVQSSPVQSSSVQSSSVQFSSVQFSSVQGRLI
jgi:hypothetical protein